MTLGIVIQSRIRTGVVTKGQEIFIASRGVCRKLEGSLTKILFVAAAASMYVTALVLWVEIGKIRGIQKKIQLFNISSHLRRPQAQSLEQATLRNSNTLI